MVQILLHQIMPENNYRELGFDRVFRRAMNTVQISIFEPIKIFSERVKFLF